MVEMGYAIDQWKTTSLLFLTAWKDSYNANPDIKSVCEDLADNEGVARSQYQDPRYHDMVVKGLFVEKSRDLLYWKSPMRSVQGRSGQGWYHES